MNLNYKVINLYLKEVSTKLNCTKSMKSVFLNELKDDIEKFTESIPSVTKDYLYKKFGTPKEVSNGLFDRNDYNILLKKAKRKAFIWKLISIGASVLLTLVICCFIKLLHHFGGTIEVTDAYNY